MKSASSVIPAIVIAAILVSGCCFQANSQSLPPQASERGATSLLLYLNKLGKKHDVFFTIESSWDNGGSRSLASYPVSQNFEEEALKDEMRRLAGVVPNITFQIDPKNPQIFHVVDERLASVQVYGMDQVLPDFRFTGMLTGLLAEIASRGIRVISAPSRSPGDPLSDGSDRSTSIQTSPASMTVRSILSDFLPLAAYSHVLWTATTQRRPGAVTAISFRGPRSQELSALPLQNHLFWLANEHDAFFTIEESWTKGEYRNSFASNAVSLDSTRADLKDELQRLSEIVPNFQFQIDLKNPHIVHVRDARLIDSQPSSLDRTIPHINLTVSLAGLVAEVAHNGVAVAIERSGLTGGHLPDTITIVQVKANDATARSVLTDFLPLANYNRVLWTATTERRSGAVTVVDFYGQTMSRKATAKVPE
jgi:hypothetical protein